jgi:hypothetical protein
VSADCPLPLPSKESFLTEFTDTIGDADPKAQSALKDKHHVGYRNLIGKLIYAMVTCRPDISFATVKCAQSSAAPADIHYKAGKSVMRYLYSTRNDGIYYWRSDPNDELPDHPLPALYSNPSDILSKGCPIHRPYELHGYIDSDWGTCRRTRRSFTGICLHLAGGTIAYKTRLQPTVALSSTEAEFMAAVDCAKTTLYIQSILYDLDIADYAATHLYEDNDACTAMANVGKPTTCTRHMDIRYNALCKWVERDLVVLERIDTSQNPPCGSLRQEPNSNLVPLTHHGTRTTTLSSLHECASGENTEYYPPTAIVAMVSAPRQSPFSPFVPISSSAIGITKDRRLASIPRLFLHITTFFWRNTSVCFNYNIECEYM